MGGKDNIKNIDSKVDKGKSKKELTVSTKDVEARMVVLRCLPVLIDADVADLYGVQTKEINQAVRNNPRKFPKGYIFS